MGTTTGPLRLIANGLLILSLLSAVVSWLIHSDQYQGWQPSHWFLTMSMLWLLAGILLRIADWASRR